MTDTELRESVARAGLFPRVVTHEQARQAAKNFIDAHFNNRDGKGVLTGIPARPDHDDLVLTDYIRQREAIEALMQPEIDRRVAEERAKLLERLRDELCRDAYERGFWDGADEQRITEHGDPPHKDCVSEGYQNWLANPPALAQFEKENSDDQG